VATLPLLIIRMSWELFHSFERLENISVTETGPIRRRLGSRNDNTIQQQQQDNYYYQCC